MSTQLSKFDTLHAGYAVQETLADPRGPEPEPSLHIQEVPTKLVLAGQDCQPAEYEHLHDNPPSVAVLPS